MQQDRKDQLVVLVNVEQLVELEQWELLVHRALLDFLGRLDLQDQLV